MMALDLAPSTVSWNKKFFLLALPYKDHSLLFSELLCLEYQRGGNLIPILKHGFETEWLRLNFRMIIVQILEAVKLSGYSSLTEFSTYAIVDSIVCNGLTMIRVYANYCYYKFW